MQFRLALCVGWLLLSGGCSGRPTRVPPPNVDPAEAAQKAIELYDTNQDGVLDESELIACPGMRTKLAQYDANSDGKVQRDELETRLADLLRHEVGLTQLQCRLKYRGRPLSGAEVVLEPEPYLGSEVQAATGTTNSRGTAQMSIPAEYLPSDLKRLRAVHYGTFKVRITHPTIELPARYNSQTELGYETEAGNPYVDFELQAT